MNWPVIVRTLGMFLAFYSVTFVPSLLLAWWYADGEAMHFLAALLITLGTGLALWLPLRQHRAELKLRDGFLLVTLFWVVLSAAGAIPFAIGLHLDFTDSVFEAVSGFTTTGATVIVGIDDLPQSILYHRQQIQWLGGMGVVVLALAILPLLGVGGMQLYRAEASGITKEEKLTPRIANTAQALWVIYVTLTIACATAYWWAGMTPFDAICHAYTTVSTAGYSTHDASIGYFDSVSIELICIVFMLLGGVNYALHFVAWRRRSLATYVRDPEARAYILIWLFALVMVAASLYVTRTYAATDTAVRQAAFQVTSVLTSTGFMTANFAMWPLHLPLVLVILSFIGGCAGSTAGGIKVVRVMLLTKIGFRQMRLLAHTRSVALIKLGPRRVPEEIVYAVLGYYSLYLATSLFLMVAMMAAGLDFVSALGAVIASINLLGAGLGEVATTFASVSPVVKWLAVFGMLVGRLEVFPILILFTPGIWRH
jgi:trk system potassium uptake protein TrkH